jgi:hypothetical protein
LASLARVLKIHCILFKQMKEYHVMTLRPNLLSADEQEDLLWIASQRYMLGEISVEDLEKEERPHSRNLRQAEIALAKLKPEWTPRTADEHEDHLWRASRRYMLGEISIAELEDIERPHAHHLRKAIMAVAQSRLRWHFHLRWGFLIDFFRRDRKHL